MCALPAGLAATVQQETAAVEALTAALSEGQWQGVVMNLAALEVLNAKHELVQHTRGKFKELQHSALKQFEHAVQVGVCVCLA